MEGFYMIYFNISCISPVLFFRSKVENDNYWKQERLLLTQDPRITYCDPKITV
jgi:hypothetical protein